MKKKTDVFHWYYTLKGKKENILMFNISEIYFKGKSEDYKRDQ